MIFLFRFSPMKCMKFLLKCGNERLKMKKINKRIFKKNPEELQEYLQTMRQHHIVPARKGKGSYKRKSKYKNFDE